MCKEWNVLWIFIVAVHIEDCVGDDGIAPLSLSALPSLDSPNFQRLFLADVTRQIDKALTNCMEKYLRGLQRDPAYSEYSEQINDILMNKVSESDYMADHYKIMEEKIVFVKQLLDSQKSQESEEETQKLYTLRNMKFFKKLQNHMNELEAEGEREWREMKMYRVCQKFQISKEHEKQKQEAEKTRPHQQPSLWTHIQLAPIALDRLQKSDSNSIDNTNNSTESFSRFVSLNDFGEALYERIKLIGAEIIDDCLITIRKLLIQVGEEERPDNSTHSDGLTKLLEEIEAIMRTADFATKRERLYHYMQTNLTQDYEEFKSSQSSQQDLAELLLKMQLRGLDIFFNFLFSNFEFLEHLHSEWSQATEKLTESAGDSKSVEDLHEVRKINKLYNDFKQNSDDIRKYEAYLLATKQLYERTQAMSDGGDGAKLYEILYSAAQNVGTVTLNIIERKCSQL